MQKVIHFVLPIVGFCIIGCTDTSYLVGTYAGLIGLDDGDVRVKLHLNQGGNAELDGLSDKRMEGTWYLEKVGAGKEDGIWVSFKLPEYRMRFELKPEQMDLRLVRVSARTEGKTILRTIQLKKSKPLLRRL